MSMTASLATTSVLVVGLDGKLQSDFLASSAC